MSQPFVFRPVFTERPPVEGDFVWVTDGRFRGCILTYLGRDGGWHLCRNHGFGGPVRLSTGDYIDDAVRTRSVAVYLTKDDIARRAAGESVVPHAYPRVS